MVTDFYQNQPDQRAKREGNSKANDASRSLCASKGSLKIFPFITTAGH